MIEFLVNGIKNMVKHGKHMGQPSANTRCPFSNRSRCQFGQEAEAEISVAGTLLSPQELEVAVLAVVALDLGEFYGISVETWDIPWGFP